MAATMPQQVEKAVFILHIVSMSLALLLSVTCWAGGVKRHPTIHTFWVAVFLKEIAALTPTVLRDPTGGDLREIVPCAAQAVFNETMWAALPAFLLVFNLELARIVRQVASDNASLASKDTRHPFWTNLGLCFLPFATALPALALCISGLLEGDIVRVTKRICSVGETALPKERFISLTVALGLAFLLGIYIISSVTQVRLAVATIVHSDIDVSFLLRVFILTLLSGGAAGLAIALKLVRVNENRVWLLDLYLSILPLALSLLFIGTDLVYVWLRCLPIYGNRFSSKASLCPNQHGLSSPSQKACSTIPSQSPPTFSLVSSEKRPRSTASSFFASRMSDLPASAHHVRYPSITSIDPSKRTSHAASSIFGSSVELALGSKTTSPQGLCFTLQRQDGNGSDAVEELSHTLEVKDSPSSFIFDIFDSAHPLPRHGSYLSTFDDTHSVYSTSNTYRSGYTSSPLDVRFPTVECSDLTSRGPFDGRGEQNGASGETVVLTRPGDTKNAVGCQQSADAPFSGLLQHMNLPTTPELVTQQHHNRSMGWI